MVIARMEQYLNENDNMRVEIEELEFLLGPEDSEVDLRHILRCVDLRNFQLEGHGSQRGCW